MKLRTLVLFLTLQIPILLETTHSQEHYTIDEVDIIGRMELRNRDTTITREQASILPSITRISSLEIERQGAVVLTDVLRYVPGGWTESRGRKTKQFFSVRGQAYPYPDYSINGIWQKEFEETVYFFSALDIESVEIVRSSGALVKGLTGLSGVVDVKTIRPDKETLSALVRYGTLNNYTTNVRYGNRVNDVSFVASAGLTGTDGPPDRNGSERISSFHTNAFWDVTDRVEVNAGATYIGGMRQLVSITESGAPNIANRREEFNPINTLLAHTKVTIRGENGSETGIQANLSYRDLEYTSVNIQNNAVSEHTELDYEYGLNVLHSRPLSSSNTIRAGILYNHWVAPEGKRYYVGRACDVHTVSAVIASEQRSGRFIFDGGLRLIGGYISEFGGFGIEGSAAGFQNVEPITDELAPLEWQSVLGASYITSPRVSLHYNFAGGTVSPRRGGINDQGERPGNEVRLQHDAGLRYNCMNGNEFSVSAFFIQRNNAIELTGGTVVAEGDRLVELYRNIDKRSYGLEASAGINVPEINSRIFGNATVMRTEDKTSSGYSKDNRMPGVILNGGVSYSRSGFDVNLFVNYTGPYQNNRFVDRAWTELYGDYPLGDFFAVDITAGYTFDRRFSTRIFTEARNLLDKKYQTVAGYPDPGRLFSTGARVFF